MAIAENIDWKSLLADKWLLWDTSAIIKVIKFEGEGIFGELKNNKTENVYIHPVQLELLATKVKQDSLKRSAIMAEYLEIMPFTNKELVMARKLQTAIGTIAQPSPSDLYIGATLAASSSDKFFLITHNIKDFPAPYFVKECYITLYTDLGICSLAILSFNKTSLSA